MKISKILEKLGLTPEDQNTLQESIQALIDETVAAKEDELQKHYQTVSESFVQEELAKREDELKATLEEQFNQKFAQLEAETIDNLDAFLDNEINESISDELINKIAINESLQPVVEGIKNVFASVGLELDSEASVTIKEMREELDTLKSENSKLISEKIELTTISEKAACEIKLREICEGLTTEQEQKVRTIYEGKSFDEISTKAQNYVDLLIEEENKTEETIEETVNEEDVIEPDAKKTVKKDPLVSQADKWM